MYSHECSFLALKRYPGTDNLSEIIRVASEYSVINSTNDNPSVRNTLHHYLEGFHHFSGHESDESLSRLSARLPSQISQEMIALVHQGPVHPFKITLYSLLL